MILEFNSISALMRRLNNIKKKHPEIQVVILGSGITTKLSVGYVNLNKPINEFNILTQKEYDDLKDKESFSMVVVILGNRSWK